MTEIEKTELLEKKLKKAKMIIKKGIYYIDTIDENGFHDKERCKFISEVEEFLKNED